jgi:hypothetical protein
VKLGWLKNHANILFYSCLFGCQGGLALWALWGLCASVWRVACKKEL